MIKITKPILNPKTGRKSINGLMASLMTREMLAKRDALGRKVGEGDAIINNPQVPPPEAKQAMTTKQMAAQAREHWKVTNPEIYRQMIEDNALVESSEAAAKLTMREVEALKLIGMSQREAWQESRHLFIFRTAEELEKAYQPDRDENGKVIQPGWQKDSAPLPKKTSTPLKSIQEKLFYSTQKEMLSGKNVPKKPREK